MDRPHRTIVHGFFSKVCKVKNSELWVKISFFGISSGALDRVTDRCPTQFLKHVKKNLWPLKNVGQDEKSRYFQGF